MKIPHRSAGDCPPTRHAAGGLLILHPRAAPQWAATPPPAGRLSAAGTGGLSAERIEGIDCLLFSSLANLSSENKVLNFVS